MKEVSIIYESGLLPVNLVDELQDMIPELKKTWETKQIFRTETEMRVSVLNDGYHPTNASKYWQCVREQSGMLESLTMSGFEYRKLDISIRKLKKKISEELDEFAKEELEIDLEMALFSKAQMEQQAKDRIREIRLWDQIMKELDDGSFCTEDVNSHQAETLLLQLERRAGALTQGSSQGEVLNVVGPLQNARQYYEEKQQEKLQHEEQQKLK